MHVEFGDAWSSGSIVMAVVCALIAHSKGRSVLVWGLLGFLFSCFALLFCILADDLSVEAKNREEQRHADRRLKEGLRNEKRRLGDMEKRVIGRLDAHDLALGLDTRQIHAPLAQLEGLAPAALSEPRWFYEESGATAGPISRRALMSLLSTGALDRGTLVWTEGMVDWAPLGDTLPHQS